MKTILSPFNRLLETAQRKFVRSRHGSVLILVVVLLVLMALIGTAFMSLAQADRTTAAIHTNITQESILLDSITEMVKSTIAADLTASGEFRPSTLNYYGPPTAGNAVAFKVASGSPVTNTPSYLPITGTGPDNSAAAQAMSYSSVLPTNMPTVNAGTPWLASRAPDLFDWTQIPNTTQGPSLPFNPPYWAHITGPLLGTQFESPVWSNPTIPVVFDRNVPNVPGLTGIGLEARFVPTTTPNGLPAFDIYDRGVGTWIKINQVIAADADGDGIADSALVKLPMGTTTANGQITWYMGARILDNTSAVNANTAWTPSTTYLATTAAAPAIPGDFFPSSIDLFNLLHFSDASVIGPTNPMTRLLSYRFGLTFPQQEPYTNPSGPYPAFEDGAAPRTDFFNSLFSTSLEASWMQLGRRLRNSGVSTNAGAHFQALPVTDALALAHNFILPDTTIGLGTLETFLPASTSSLTNIPWTDTLSWFSNNFNFFNDVNLSSSVGNNQNRSPIRSLLTTDNPVGNFSPTQFRDLGTISASSSTVPPPPPINSTAALRGFRFGDMVSYQYTDGGPVSRRYVCVNPALASLTPPTPVIKTGGVLPTQITTFDNDTWIYEPWQSTQTKTNINTATFGQLWLAYWSVMADQARGGNPSAGFAPDGNLAPAFPNSQFPDSPRMFRSPLRYRPPGAGLPTMALSPMQVMQLRAALAAVNAIDMRDSDDDVTSRTVHLIDRQNPVLPDVVATVYGMERQPFITQVYASQYPPNMAPPNSSGFIAIELYNPYPVAIDLSNYCLATTPRTMATTPLIPPNMIFTAIPWTGGGGLPPVIPAYGSIIIASDPNPPAGVTFDNNFSTRLQGAATGGPTVIYTVTGLSTAFDNELYLMRVRREVIGSPGQYTRSSLLATTTGGPSPLPSSPGSMIGAYNEGSVLAPNPADMIPVDSYDLTGLPATSTPALTTEWYYVRPNPGGSLAAIPNKAWHYVYPGHYTFGTSGLPRLVDGTLVGLPGALAGSLFALSNNAINATPPFLGNIPMGVPSTVSNVETLTSTLNLYRDIPIQLNGPDSAGPNGLRNSTASIEPNAFPYGGFARNGDMLKVPFIGSYRLAIPVPPASGLGLPLQIIEMNPVTMDSVMALGLSQPLWGEPLETALTVSANVNGPDPICDGTALQNGIEQVGRFYPLGPSDFLGAALIPFPPNDFLPTAIASTDPVGTPNPRWLYHWTTRLFDYLTVQSPQQDYLPDVDPAPLDFALPVKAGLLYKYNPSVGAFRFPVPTPNDNPLIVNGEPTNPNSLTEEASGVQGLININSAPWRVLMAVPWLPPDFPNPGSGTVNYATRTVAQANIALSIVYYRDINDGTANSGPPHGHGPFRSLFELNNVPILTFIATPPSIPNNTLFQNILTPLTPISTVNMTPPQGNLTDVYRTASTPPGATGDFEARFNMINRVSNLITTRSDSFTAYIVLEGWLNAETPNSTLAYQRRAAFFVDRTKVTPTNPLPTVTNIPTGN